MNKKKKRPGPDHPDVHVLLLRREEARHRGREQIVAHDLGKPRHARPTPSRDDTQEFLVRNDACFVALGQRHTTCTQHCFVPGLQLDSEPLRPHRCRARGGAAGASQLCKHACWCWPSAAVVARSVIPARVSTRHLSPHTPAWLAQCKHAALEDIQRLLGQPHPTASWHDSPVRTAFLSRLLTRFGTLPPFEQVAHFKKHKSSETPPFRFVLLFLFPSPNEIRGAERHLLKPRPLQATPHEALQEITDVHVDGPRACGNTPVRKCASAAFGSRVFKRARSILEISTSSL